MEYHVNFPNPNSADKDGLVAVGGELSSSFILSAYAQGIFPWFNDGEPILWWSPDPRLVLYPDELKVSKSLKQVIRSGKFIVRIDYNFPSVIENCATLSRSGQSGTWITNEMKNAYKDLHKEGFVHSFEVYQGTKLVGGLYGLSLGRAFFGESMFFKVSNASKVALYYLVEWCKNNNYHFIDAQQSTSHLKSLGAKEIEREQFLLILENALKFSSIVGNWEHI